MRVAYFGTAPFAVPALRALAKSVVLVVSQPDRPTGRGMKFQPSPVRTVAMELGIPTATPLRARDPEFVKTLQDLHLDALVVAAYGQILSTAVLESAACGGINMHGSILPSYRGAAPIQRCLMNGDTETGVTLMQMDRGMDTGDIIAIATVPIDPDETAGELQTRMADVAAGLVKKWMPRIVAGDFSPTPQNADLASIAAKLERSDGELAVTMPVQEAYNRFRGVTPTPGAFIETNFGRLKLTQVRRGELVGAAGAYLGSDEVGFEGGSLKLLEVQPEGRGRMTLDAFANGLRLKLGDALVSS